MSDKHFKSTENTQWQYVDGNGETHNVDEFRFSDMQGFFVGIRTYDKVKVTVHYNAIKTKDLRFE